MGIPTATNYDLQDVWYYNPENPLKEPILCRVYSLEQECFGIGNFNEPLVYLRIREKNPVGLTVFETRCTQDFVYNDRWEALLEYQKRGLEAIKKFSEFWKNV